MYSQGCGGSSPPFGTKSLEVRERSASRSFLLQGIVSTTTKLPGPARKNAIMPTQLDKILAHTLLEVNARKASTDLNELEHKAMAHTPRGFANRLRQVSATEPAIISEIKKASPSKGLIRPDFYPAQLARGFEAVGAACLSVLTDQEFFQGSLADLEAASQAVKIPCLRKDFVVDPFQILEARAFGADAVLLIVAAHDDVTLRSLLDVADDLELDVLCEVHSREELDRALCLGFDMIGVNSRDLRTFTMHPELFADLAAIIPNDLLRVAESGIRTREEILHLRNTGYHGFLIGETLMRQPDPAGTLALLLDRDYASEF
jgi:indole-3-glycerol phosphate synthase